MAERCRFITFGCKVNQYDTQLLRERMTGENLREAKTHEEADLFVVNTCTVTESARREAERVVRRIRRKNPHARIRVTGCAAVSNRDHFTRIPDVEVVEQPSDAASSGISSFEGHTRAFLKVQNGCDLRCSFCIIPSVRGGSRSRILESILPEARRLVANGYREIVLTGVHLGGFGKDLPEKPTLVDLARVLLEIPGIGRIRLSSIESNEVTPDLVDLLASDGRLCPHLHIPLQSGDDAVLKAMRRRANTRQYLRMIDRLKTRVPDIALTTDVIVGFPGETEQQFDNTMNLCRAAGFSRVHLFPYSPREGTDAAALLDSVPPVEKKRRMKRLEALAAEMAEEFYRRRVGTTADLLVEETGAVAKGYTERYIPCALEPEGRPPRPGEILSVQIVSADRKGVYGRRATHA